MVTLYGIGYNSRELALTALGVLYFVVCLISLSLCGDGGDIHRWHATRASARERLASALTTRAYASVTFPVGACSRLRRRRPPPRPTQSRSAMRAKSAAHSHSSRRSRRVRALSCERRDRRARTSPERGCDDARGTRPPFASGVLGTSRIARARCRTVAKCRTTSSLSRGMTHAHVPYIVTMRLQNSPGPHGSLEESAAWLRLAQHHSTIYANGAPYIQLQPSEGRR